MQQITVSVICETSIDELRSIKKNQLPKKSVDSDSLYDSANENDNQTIDNNADSVKNLQNNIDISKVKKIGRTKHVRDNNSAVNRKIKAITKIELGTWVYFTRWLSVY